MKKTLITALLVCLVTFGKAQNCITVNWSYFDNPSGDNIRWRLLVNWSANGTKHLQTIALNSGDTILNECYQTSGGNGNQTGTITYPITISGGAGNLVGIFRRFTGTCGNGTECEVSQTLINNVLPIKITGVTAKNIGNNTEVRFRIESVDGDNVLTLNVVLRNGTKRQYKIQMPDTIKSGQQWKIVIDNVTQKYTLIKL